MGQQEISEAAETIRAAYKSDGRFRDAVVASIRSAMIETTIVWEEWEYDEAARKIADRVMGCEQ